MHIIAEPPLVLGGLSRSARTLVQDFGRLHWCWDDCTSVAVYRAFAASSAEIGLTGGNLLYIGVSADPARRLNQHAREKNWWPFVEVITIHEYATRADALLAESIAIGMELPAENLDIPVRITKSEMPRHSSCMVLTRAAPNTWHVIASWQDDLGPQ